MSEHASPVGADVVELYNVTQAAGLQKVGERPATREELATEKLRALREGYQRKIDFCDRAAVVLIRFPADVIARANICETDEDVVTIFNLTREQVVAAIRASGASWKKEINAAHSHRIDYLTEIDGVKIELWAAPPPPSCRIEEEVIDVPAHQEIKRTIVCH
jgi:hypothetical protein